MGTEVSRPVREPSYQVLGHNKELDVARDSEEKAGLCKV